MDSSYIENYSYVEGLSEGENQYSDTDFSGKTKIVDARYVKSEVARYNGNPFIEALPRPRAQRDIMTACTVGIPGFIHEKEIQKSTYSQMLDIQELRSVRFPLPMNIELEQTVYEALCLSYERRSLLHDDDIDTKFETGNTESISHGILTGNDDDSANAGFSLIGYSGCGKSSALHSLFMNYPQVIIHHGHGIEQIPQIVYLVVNCPVHSNFRELYKNIGTAIDRALGNVKPVYSQILDKGSSANLGLINDKVRELVEKFSIGIIIFDEIQLLNFDPTTENSFQGLLHLCNRTKVAFGVVGTEDAKDKIFGTNRLLPEYASPSGRGRKRPANPNKPIVGNLRQARRLGPQIPADRYCEDYDIFRNMVTRLFRYQWFKEPVAPDEEITKALYDCSKGIIDQLVGIYMYMQLDYIKPRNKPVIDADYVRKTAERHYPGVQIILQHIKDPKAEEQRAELAMHAEKAMETMLQDEKTKASIEAVKAQNDSADMEKVASMKSNVVSTILMVTSDYTKDSVEQAFNKVVSTKTGQDALSDEKQLTQLVFKRLASQKTDRRPRTKKASKEEQDAKIMDYLKDDSPDDLLDDN